ncbi:GNAT family N-acetyltransferase [Streptomyces diacarni]|uniref:GNAT family N-acetyltransferase n=1 Tax=Streptomyces diacarni TaxID=2800381 RepID=UPI0033D30C5A
MRFLPATADPTVLDRAATFVPDGPVTAVTAERFADELDANRLRPEWTWLAEDERGQVLARALWWGRADSERPIALDCLQVCSTVADPVAVAAPLVVAGHAAFDARPLYNLSLPADWRARPEMAEAVAWRREVGLRTGLSREVQRLRYEWTPEVGAPRAGGRLTFREGSDEEFLDAFARVSVDSLYLDVVPEQRGLGLIDEILTEITRFHAAADAERITATTDIANVPMAAAFDRGGYAVTQIRLILEAEAPRPA